MNITWKRKTTFGGLRIVYEGYDEQGVKVAEIARNYRAGGRRSGLQASIPEYDLDMPKLSGGSFTKLKDAKAYAAAAYRS